MARKDIESEIRDLKRRLTGDSIERRKMIERLIALIRTRTLADLERESR